MIARKNSHNTPLGRQALFVASLLTSDSPPPPDRGALSAHGNFPC